MLLINRLKDYCFSLEEIKSIFESEELMDEVLFTALNKKKKEIAIKVRSLHRYLHQIFPLIYPMHPLLTLHLIEMVQDEAVNTSHSQMIFNTHDTGVLDSYSFKA